VSGRRRFIIVSGRMPVRWEKARGARLFPQEHRKTRDLHLLMSWSGCASRIRSRGKPGHRGLPPRTAQSEPCGLQPAAGGRDDNSE
jgi:hypothetical protein